MLSKAEYLNGQLEDVLPNDINITDPVQRKQLAESMKEFYLHGKDISKNTEEEFTQVITY